MPKNLKEFLKENTELLNEEDAQGYYSLENPERFENDGMDLTCVENPETMLRLNTVVRSVGRRLYSNINVAINYLWTKLQAVSGLGFDLPKIVEEKGKLTLPLTQWGGIFEPMTGKYLDGISHKMPDGKGLELEFEWKRLDDTGNFQVKSQIISGKKPKAETDEKKAKEKPIAGNSRNGEEF